MQHTQQTETEVFEDQNVFIYTWKETTLKRSFLMNFHVN